jgi:hypothetical protein
MGSLIDELQRREAVAREEAEDLRGQIALLGERLARVEERLSRLVITRETVEEVLSEPGAQVPPAVVPDEAVPSRPGHLSQAGVLAVPPWRPGLEASVLPEAYRDLLEVLEDAGRPLRAGQIAAAAGLGTGKAKVEGLRSKLKRLAGRGWLAEEPAGLALPPRPGNTSGSTPAQRQASTHSAPDLPLCRIPAVLADRKRLRPCARPRPGPPARNQHCRLR